MKIYSPAGVETVDVNVNDDSYRYRAIMGENELTVKFLLPEFYDFEIGSYVVFEAATYTLYRPHTFVKNGSRDYEFTLIFESYKSLLDRYKYREVYYIGGVYTGFKRLKFTLTAKPSVMLQMLVDNLNERDGGWTVGTCIDDTEKTLAVNHNYCGEVLNSIVELFKTEYEITGKQISLLKLEYNKTLAAALPLSYGYGNGFKTGVKRGNYNNSKAIEVLYVQGGTKNIAFADYGANELLLPKNQVMSFNGTYFDNETPYEETGERIYKTDANGLFITRADILPSTKIEDSLDCSEIYPSRVGEISLVTPISIESNFYDFSDEDIPEALDYSDCITKGEKMTVIFQTGALAGKEFDISLYVHLTRTFKIVPQEIDGEPMPSETFKPAVGDKYAVFGVSLPAAYISDDLTRTGASWDMFREAVKYFYENETPRFTFTGELDGIWANANWETGANVGAKLKLGGYVKFTDAQFQTDPQLIRIVSIKDYLNSPRKPVVEISNVTVSAKTAATVLGTIKTENTKTEALNYKTVRFAKRGFRDATETAEMLAAAIFNYSGAINPITVATMQLLVGDESLQFRFLEDINHPDSETATPVIDFDTATKVFSIESGGVDPLYLQHMTLENADIRASVNYATCLMWTMACFTPVELSDPTKKYYVYARCSKTTAVGSFAIYETPKAIDEEAGYYHFLMALINSEIDGDRTIPSVYGFTEILPSRITTGRIVSADGDTYFDLEGNLIAGTINFKDGLISSMIKLASGATITAGLQGDSNVNVAAWFGGTYQDALNNLASIIFRKDGSGQLAGGLLWWDILGKIFFGKIGDSETIKISTEAIPSLAEIGNKEHYIVDDGYTHFVQLFYANPADSPYTPTITRTLEFEIENDGLMELYIEFIAGGSAEVTGVGIDASILFQQFVDNAWVTLESGEYNSAVSMFLSLGEYALVKGKYRFVATGISGGIPAGMNPWIALQIISDVRYQLTVKKLVIGIDGIAMFDSMSDNYFRFSLADATFQQRFVGNMEYLDSSKTYGIKLSPAGLQKTSNGGASWAAI